ncbi:MAG: YkoF family thiamine/hydroxymethylpyrimidine-binding protein [Lachnospiraceae bacterium]|nr:YkoF family thiamine/hydroxymethylpyrimidine-binding protein [Lachnospiraceae bacterium]
MSENNLNNQAAASAATSQVESNTSCAACGCNAPDLPWSGRGTDLPIVGCRFSLYPMSDNFIDLILGSLEKTDTSCVWSESDALSTVYRGRLEYVADAVKALFINAYRDGVHMAIEGQFSKGCPGDVSGDSKLDEVGEAPNKAVVAEKHFPVKCKFALYPMGCGDYISHIADVWRMAEDRGLQPTTIHYATRLTGDVHDIFDYLKDVCEKMDTAVSHYIIHFTMNCNSPTEE